MIQNLSHWNSKFQLGSWSNCFSTHFSPFCQVSQTTLLFTQNGFHEEGHVTKHRWDKLWEWRDGNTGKSWFLPTIMTYYIVIFFCNLKTWHLKHVEKDTETQKSPHIDSTGILIGRIFKWSISVPPPLILLVFCFSTQACYFFHSHWPKFSFSSVHINAISRLNKGLLKPYISISWYSSVPPLFQNSVPPPLQVLCFYLISIIPIWKHLTVDKYFTKFHN